jgi:hypothetical protein
LQPETVGEGLSRQLTEYARILYRLEKDSARIKELIDYAIRLLLDDKGLTCKAMLVIDDQNRVYLVPIEEDR